jgi:hypothetical protein
MSGARSASRRIRLTSSRKMFSRSESSVNRSATLPVPPVAAEIYHLKEPQRLPLVMSPEEAKRLLAMAGTSRARALLALG